MYDSQTKKRDIIALYHFLSSVWELRPVRKNDVKIRCTYIREEIVYFARWFDTPHSKHFRAMFRFLDKNLLIWEFFPQHLL